jgi:hypothetical protein
MMSVVDSIFVAVPETSSQVAAWLVEAARCEVMSTDGDEVRMRRRGATVDGWLGVVAQPNGYIEPDPEPDEIQAMDPYPIEVQVRGGGTDEGLHAEAGLIFDELIASRPDVAMLLVHNLDTLVSAYLPGAGTHAFEPSISPDAPDVGVWRDWVVR